MITLDISTDIPNSKEKELHRKIITSYEKSISKISRKWNLTFISLLFNRTITFILYMVYGFSQGMIIMESEVPGYQNKYQLEYCLNRIEPLTTSSANLAIYAFSAIQIVSMVVYFIIFRYYYNTKPFYTIIDIRILKENPEIFFKELREKGEKDKDKFINDIFEKIRGYTKNAIKLTSRRKFWFLTLLYPIEKFIENTYILDDNHYLQCISNFTSVRPATLYTISATYVPEINICIGGMFIFIITASFAYVLSALYIPHIIYIIAIIINNPSELIYLPQFIVFTDFKLTFWRPKFWTDINYIITYISIFADFIDYFNLSFQ